VTACKNLKYVERDFRHIKSDDLGLRPVFHRLGKRVRGHVLICMLAAYLTWHLRQGWAPLTYTDEEPPPRRTPSPPRNARHPPRPWPHASTTRTDAPTSATRDSWTTWAPSPATSCTSPGTPAAVPVLTTPTSRQKEAFDLIGAAIPSP